MDEAPSGTPIATVLAELNEQQRSAVLHGSDPLLIVAGAGTGKTATLAHRVAYRIATGTDPGRILLLTFTRRAAAEMLRRVDGILRHLETESRRARRDLPQPLRRRAEPAPPTEPASPAGLTPSPARQGPAHPVRRRPGRSGAAPFTPRPRACSACTAGPSASIRPSPSSTAATPKTSWECFAPSSAWPRATAASRSKAPAWTSTAGA